MFLCVLLTPLALRMTHHLNTAGVRKTDTARGQKSGFHPAQLQGCSVLTWYAQRLGKAFNVARGCTRHNRSWHTVTLKPMTRIAISVSGTWVQRPSQHRLPLPEVWLLVLEVSSDTVQPCNLADLFKNEILLPFAQELHLRSGPCPVLAWAILQTCLGLAECTGLTSQPDLGLASLLWTCLIIWTLNWAWLPSPARPAHLAQGQWDWPWSVRPLPSQQR